MAEYRPETDFYSSGISGDVSEKAQMAELQTMMAVEQKKAQFMAQVHNFMDVCWDKCVDKPGSKLDSRTESCLVSCVDRFVDTTLIITNRFAQMVQKKQSLVSTWE
ncbi:mitochondrial import inner membrane translocase subunit Tim8 B [Protopterus annectens]|uniref:mitochondrial import inner membrane translocase subunit Tim8 B n=1 Tax=Protopterus annectens TaxID=7888 RepID=UPI001CFAAAC8|nr:mitochondrial import inner membrane translocase subunit Tim8 B [Protopterus annectens]